MPGKHLGEFEQLVLLAMLRQGEGAYAAGVTKELEARNRGVSRGALYRTFDRLETKGFIRWELEDASERAERGGHPLRRFWVTEPGLEALREARDTLLDFWKGVKGLAERT